MQKKKETFEIVIRIPEARMRGNTKELYFDFPEEAWELISINKIKLRKLLE